ncbi:MAG TPA: magnesium transporter [Polyangiaceae bacterium]
MSEYPGPALPIADLRDAWAVLSKADRADGFRILKRSDAEDFFLGLGAADMAELLHALPEKERRVWVRLLAPDDAADLLQSADAADRDMLIACMDDPTRKEVTALMAYAEDEAGGLMNPRFARVRPDMTVDEAVSYLRRQARENIETIYYVYVADEQQHLLGVVSFRDLFIASSDKKVRDVMATNLITVGEEVHQEDVSRLFADEALMAIPVVDPEGRIKGIVTVDDIVDVVQEEATEDAQKFGGMEALEEPYLQIALARMIKKRGGWLAALFLGEMLTASAMAFFQDEISRAVVLALFVPLIISSGGNSGSQASTLVIRAMALGEVRLRDWWRVVRRELAVGLALGTMLGVIGFIRIVAWQAVSPIYGDHYMRVAETVLFSLIGVVMFGTIAGSVLPFVLRRVGFDPASASAPFVATLVDVTGLVIYFSVGSLMLRGTLL